MAIYAFPLFSGRRRGAASPTKRGRKFMIKFHNLALAIRSRMWYDIKDIL